MDVTADQIGWAATGVVAAAMVAQVAGNMVRDKLRPKQTTAETSEPADPHSS